MFHQAAGVELLAHEMTSHLIARVWKRRVSMIAGRMLCCHLLVHCSRSDLDNKAKTAHEIERAPRTCRDMTNSRSLTPTRSIPSLLTPLKCRKSQRGSSRWRETVRHRSCGSGGRGDKFLGGIDTSALDAGIHADVAGVRREDLSRATREHELVRSPARLGPVAARVVPDVGLLDEVDAGRVAVELGACQFTSSSSF